MSPTLLRSPANKAWLGLAAYVIGYDTWAIAAGRETLSTAFLRSAKHPVKRWPIIVLVAVTTAHLFGRLPQRFDPFHGYGVALRRLDRRPPRL